MLFEEDDVLYDDAINGIPKEFIFDKNIDNNYFDTSDEDIEYDE